mgnify:CR=1 FL=1
MPTVQNSLPEETVMREVFAALVAQQDGGDTPDASRAAMAQKFGLDADTVRRIEGLGISKTWPPL